MLTVVLIVESFSHLFAFMLFSFRQAAEMSKVMNELGNTFSDHDVNAVASQHFDAQQVNKKKTNTDKKN